MTAAAIEWREEWVPLSKIIKHAPFQARRKLDASAVKRYESMTKAGTIPPPIKVAKVKGHLYLVDGWHRWEAGALTTAHTVDENTVYVLLADMSREQALWVSAQANMAHGVPYKPSELRAVFQAFIRAKMHRKPDGSFMSYREIAPHIGRPHTTIRNWMWKHFPKIAAEMAGDDPRGNPEASPEMGVPSLAELHRQEAVASIESITQRLPAMSAEGRWDVVQGIQATLKEAQRLGTCQPAAHDF